MKYGYVFIDQTYALSPLTQRSVGRYWELFIFNTEESIYCCELKPSYYMLTVGFETDLTISDDLYSELYQFLECSDHYRHCDTLTKFGILGDFEDDEEAREYARANPPCYGLEYRS